MHSYKPRHCSNSLIILQLYLWSLSLFLTVAPIGFHFNLSVAPHGLYLNCQSLASSHSCTTSFYKHCTPQARWGGKDVALSINGGSAIVVDMLYHHHQKNNINNNNNQKFHSSHSERGWLAVWWKHHVRDTCQWCWRNVCNNVSAWWEKATVKSRGRRSKGDPHASLLKEGTWWENVSLSRINKAALHRVMKIGFLNITVIFSHYSFHRKYNKIYYNKYNKI